MIYIDRDKFYKDMLKRFGCVPMLTDHSSSLNHDILLDEALNMQPTADVVPMEVYKQVAWERDIAIEQVESYGVCLGENKELAEVKHGEWIGKPIAGYSDIRCSVCNVVFLSKTGKWPYCPDCGAKMDGGKKE